MSASRKWLSSSGGNLNFTDVTFIRDGLALSNLKPSTEPEVLQHHRILSILSLFQPNVTDLDLSDASEGWVSASAIKPIQNYLGEGEVPHPDLVKVGVVRRVIYPLSDDGNNSTSSLVRAVELLAELHLSAAPVLVHCRLGASRTHAVAGCYLAKKEGISFRSAVEQISCLRSVAISEELALTITRANGVTLQ